MSNISLFLSAKVGYISWCIAMVVNLLVSVFIRVDVL